MTLVSAHDLSVTLRGDVGDVRVLDALAFEVAAGEIVDVVGPSGSGKSTFLRALARLLPGATGELTLDGMPAHQIAPTRWRTLVALLPQKPVIVDASVRDNLTLPWHLAARRGAHAPTDVALAEGLERLGLDVALDRDGARLSVGQAARVAFLRTLLAEPRVLLLDEPDAALDDASADAVASLTREFSGRGGAVVRVRHHRSDGIASRRLRLEGGHLSAEDAGVVA